MRAVGSAVGRNPVSILVPCHRVIGSDGSLTGYAGGIDRKVALLRLEAGRRAQPTAMRDAAGAPLKPADVAELFGLAALWGASFLLMRMGAAEFGPVALAAVRVTGAALLLVPLLAMARPARGAARALAADRRRRPDELRAAVPLLRLRGAVDQRRHVGDLQLGVAAVRRADRAGSG